MIDNRELRIGNYVNYNDGSGHDDIRRIVGIDRNTVTSVIKGCHFATAIKSNDLIYPIHLSEEVLLKSNFIAYANVFAFELRDLDLSIDVNFTKSGGHIVSISDEKSDFSRVLSTTMKLHELQNLIASFGEELEVKWD